MDFKEDFKFIKNNKEFLEYLFLQCKNCLWEKNKLSIVAKNNNLTINKLKEYVDYYMIHFLELTTKKLYNYKLYYRSFAHFINGKLRKNYEINRAINYYQMFASLDEKKVFEEYVINLLIKINSAINNKEDINKLLLNININYYNLYVFLNIITNIDNSIKRNIIMLCKQYYDFAFDNSFNIKNINEKYEIIKMNAHKVLELAKYYAVNILNIENIDSYIDRFRKVYTYTNPKYAILETLVDIKDIEQIAMVFLENNIVISDINTFCYCIHKNWELKKQREIEKRFLMAYRLKKSIRLKNANTIKDPDYKIFREYINSPLNLNDFCKSKGITSQYFKSTFKKFINSNKGDKKLYTLLREKINSDSINEEFNNAVKCRELIKKIIYGITINGIKKDFTLFDYFLYFSDSNITSTYRKNSILNQSEKTILSRFFGPLNDVTYINKSDFINSKIEIDCQVDDKGLPIYGSGRLLIATELTDIVNIFIFNNIPMINTIVNKSIKYYLNGCLIADNSLQRK